MKILKVICSKCGYQGTITQGDPIKECPICNTRGTLQPTDEQKQEWIREKVRAHILEGFKNFGIEKTLEDINDKKAFSSDMRKIYVEEIKKMYSGRLKIGC